MLIKRFRCYSLECIDGETRLNDISVGDFPNSFSIEYFGESYDTIKEAEYALESFIENHLSIAHQSFVIVPVYHHIL